jgi:hypothetical protein
MLLHVLLALAAVPADSAAFRLAVDSARHEVLIEIEVPAPAPAGRHHGGGHADHQQRFVRFAWPVTGWLRGARIDLTDPAGRALPAGALHHANLLNLDRRLLLYDGIERVWAAGREVRPVMLPASIGIPMSAGTRLGVVVAMDGAAFAGPAIARIRISWSPSNLAPRPLSAFPIGVDVNFRPGLTAAYDLPAGASERSAEFVMPLDGRVLGIGGHLHDYGRALTLVDVETGRTVFELTPRLDSAGRLLDMPMRLVGVSGRGRALKAGRRYRLTATYDNPTGALVPDGAMGEMALLFVPDRLEEWWALGAAGPGMERELAALH